MKKKDKFKLLFCFIIVFQLFADSVYCRGWWRIYFTSPGKNQSVQSPVNPEMALAGLIDSAKKKFYGAFFELSSQKVASSLEKAHRRGVDVRLVIDSDYLEKKAMKGLIRAGIKVTGDGRSGFMHNKFAIIDERIIWTGSYNLSHNGAYRNNNNAIMIYSQDIAGIYLDEFNEMFEYNIFCNKKEYGVFPSFRKRSYVRIENTDINVYFSPEDKVENIILKTLRTAKKSIHFMAFSFTSDKIGKEMIRMFKEGVKVYGIMEKIGSNTRYSEFIKMKLQGISVKLDKNRYRMHHKVIIIDSKKIITGSYNFTAAANERNDENILIMENEAVAREYLKEFYRLYN